MSRASGLLLRTCLCTACLILSASAGNSDLIMRGHDFSERVCSFCHVVTADGSGKPVLQEPGPSFVAIAARPTTGEESLRAFLSTKHVDIGPAERMPNPRLVDYQIDEVIAYILSLRRQ